MMTSGLPSIILPEPPQWLVASPRRTAGMLLMSTLGLPCAVFQVLGPQQALCTPGSPTRRAALPSMKTSGEPLTAGPVTECGQQSLPWLSAGQRALSPTRQAGGMAELLVELFTVVFFNFNSVRLDTLFHVCHFPLI